MHFVLTPVAGDARLMVKLAADSFTVNGEFYDLALLPDTGAVRLEAGRVIIEYGETGGVNWVEHVAHHIEWTPPSTAPVGSEPEVDVQGNLEVWRDRAEAYRWQLIAVLGQPAWTAIEAWADGQDFAVQSAIRNTNLIPRRSEVIDTLAWVIGMTDLQVDDLFRSAAGFRL